MITIYALPMLISGILCALLATVTWLFRRRERINTVFSFFTLTLALDAFAYFFWFQFDAVENIHTWMRITFSAGFLVPMGLIFFVIAFTGYHQKLDERVLGIRVKHFRNSAILIIVGYMLLSQFTNLIIDIPNAPENIWDMNMGQLSMLTFPLFGAIFSYLFILAFRSYRNTADRAQKRFIFLLAAGTLLWLLFGYIGAIFFPTGSQIWSALSYLGTSTMAIFYFVAIVNYQSDKVHELNLSLERKVEDRTRELSEKNRQLADTLNQLKQMQQQVIVQEKMASLGQLVAGLTHEFNTPISTIRSMKNTKSRAIEKLQTALQRNSGNTANQGDLEKIITAISQADQVIDRGAERMDEIVRNLKQFISLDEAEMKKADVHEGLESVLALIGHDLENIEVVRSYGDIPPFVHHPGKLNQVFLNLLKNARNAMDSSGRITITTTRQANQFYLSIRDTGRGIAAEELASVFDPDFTTANSVVRANLGLSISYQIIEKHRGKIDVESEPGKGSVFTITLPMNSLPVDS